MVIPLSQYAKIKDRYCIGYFGSRKEILIQLSRARPIIEKELPGIRIYIACKDENFDCLKDEERIIKESCLESMKEEFAYFRELNTEDPNVVEKLLTESQIRFNDQLLKI